MNRFLYNVWDEYVALNCRRNFSVMVWLIVCLCGGIVFGLFFGVRGVHSPIIFDDSVNYVIVVINGQISFASMVFRALLISLRIFALIFLFTLSVYLIPLQFVFILYRGYVIGAAIVVFTASLGVSGFVTALILIVPQQFFLLCSTGLFIMFCWNYSVRMGRYGCRNCIAFNLRAVFIFYLLSLLHIVVQILLVYVIIRPFNLLI